MAELYRIENETLTSMADKIRILSGAEGTMTTAQMDSSLGDANTEVASQTDLIAQIVDALEDKAAGGSGGGSVETCTVTITYKYGYPTGNIVTATQYTDGSIQPLAYYDMGNNSTDFEFNSPLTLHNIVKNTVVTLVGYGSYDRGEVDCSGCELIETTSGMRTTVVKITEENATVTITNTY